MRVLDQALVRVLPAVPRSIVRRVAAPYIAGPTLDDARRVVSELNAGGMRATVDVLGEEISEPREAEAIARSYHAALRAIEADGLDANVSIKLTGFGLKVDPALCRSLVRELVRDADARGIFVRIDMEDSHRPPTTRSPSTVTCARRATTASASCSRRRCAARSTTSRRLAPLRPSVRLCKGIYLEAPSVAFQEFEVIRKSFVTCLDALLAAGCRTAIATHDEWLIERSLERVAELDRDAYELQMLLGVRPDRGRELVAAGHPLRIYVPYGQQWYEYSLRRLQENPKVAGYVARDVAGRLVSRSAVAGPRRLRARDEAA